MGAQDMARRSLGCAAGPIATTAGWATVLLLAVTLETSAYDGKSGGRYNGDIDVVHDGTNFGIAARCFDKDGKGLADWASAGNLGGTIECRTNDWGRKPRYALIQRKNFWGTDTGDKWRSWRNCTTYYHTYCAEIDGNSVGAATLHGRCADSC